MKISIVTSIFHLRKTRPLGYYLKPAQDLVEDMSGSDIDIHLYTNLASSHFASAENVHIYSPSIDELVQFFWNDPNWRNMYSDMLSDRPDHRFEEKLIPELIGIWLGKFEMVYRASLQSDCVLWQDSGIRMGLFQKDFSLYSKVSSLPWLYQSSIERLTFQHPMTLLSTDNYRDPFHGVDMKRYDRRTDLCRAGMFLLRSEEAEFLRNSIAENWRLMTSRGDFGTEENPLTLTYWSRHDFHQMSYSDWLAVFGLSGSKGCRYL